MNGWFWYYCQLAFSNSFSFLWYGELRTCFQGIQRNCFVKVNRNRNEKTLVSTPFLLWGVSGWTNILMLRTTTKIFSKRPSSKVISFPCNCLSFVQQWNEREMIETIHPLTQTEGPTKASKSRGPILNPYCLHSLSSVNCQSKAHKTS